MTTWFRDLYAEFTPRAIKATVTLIAVVAFGLYVFLSSPTKVTAVVTKDKSSQVSKVTLAKIFVHVTGKVRKPGIYQLDSGSRVFDVILLAGGFTSKANQGSVNLARVLTDGEQVVVTDVSTVSNSSNGVIGGLISLNLAGASQLEELPGVGPQLAGRIVDWRESNGGFKTKEDLLNVAGIGDKVYAALRDLVTL